MGDDTEECRARGQGQKRKGVDVASRGTENGRMGAVIDLEDQVPSLLGWATSLKLCFLIREMELHPTFLGHIDDSVHRTRYCS